MPDLRAGDSVVLVSENAIVNVADVGGDDGDIAVQGWLTTEKENSYKQVVKYDTFKHDGGLRRWNGRMMLAHGRRLLVGGGDEVPVGIFTRRSFVKDKGFFGIGTIYKENTPRLKRAVRDGVLNAWSIGFGVLEGGYAVDKKTGKATITKGELFETSLCTIGANDESLVEVTNSLLARRYADDGGGSSNFEHSRNHYDTRGYYWLVYGGQWFFVNSKGDMLHV